MASAPSETHRAATSVTQSPKDSDKDAISDPDHVVNVPVSPLKFWIGSIVLGAVLPSFVGPIPALPECISNINLIPGNSSSSSSSSSIDSTANSGVYSLKLPLVLGAATIFMGTRLQKRAKALFRTQNTPTRHGLEIRSLLTGDVFAWTRNPLYIATALISGGLAVLLNSGWPMVTYLPFWLYLNFLVIPREERVLENMFGDEYKNYKKRVPRWLFF